MSLLQICIKAKHYAVRCYNPQNKVVNKRKSRTQDLGTCTRLSYLAPVFYKKRVHSVLKKKTVEMQPFKEQKQGIN